MWKAVLTGGWSLLKSGGSLLTGGAVLAGGAAGTDLYVNGKGSTTAQVLKDVQTTIGGAGAEANQGIAFTGFYAFLKQIGLLLMNVTGGKIGAGLVNWANAAATNDGRVIGDGTPPINDLPSTTPNASPKVIDLASAPKPELTATGNTITVQNEISLNNLREGMDKGTFGDAFHKAGLFGQGAVNETTKIGFSVAGHGLDLLDWASGKIVEKFGGDTGYKTRDFSTDFIKAAGETPVFKPTLQTAWDRVAYGAGQGASYFIPATTPLKVVAAAGGYASYNVNNDPAPPAP